MKNKIVLLPALFLIIFVVYKNWFSFGLIASGDFGYLFNETIDRFSLFPYLWDTSFKSGLGGNVAFILSLNTYYHASAYLFHVLFHFGWDIIEKLVWFWPFIAVSVVTSIYLIKKILPQCKLKVVSALMYLCNTYILMLVSGGQIGVAMGYALAPLVLGLFIENLRGNNDGIVTKREVAAGLALALQVMFDARIAYVTMMAVGIYFIVTFFSDLRLQKLRHIVVPVVISVLLHSFWLLPLVMAGHNPIAELGSAYTSLAALNFFSFADFSHTLSFLHPNWPENIFGKTYFLQPEFLVFPILAFSSLLFRRQKTIGTEQRVLYFFALLGLIGAFLAKGVNPPFGSVYQWLFSNLPGFLLFRDSTKFYVLIALSFTVLIPYTLDRLNILIQPMIEGRRMRVSGTAILCGIFLLFWCVSIRQALLGQLGGTLQPSPVPVEYIALKDYFVNQPTFFRVLWVPAQSRFGYASDDTPAMSLDSIGVASVSAFPAWISDASNAKTLAQYGVEYIVVPTDPKGELFVSDRMYDDQLRQTVIHALSRDNPYTRVSGFGNIAVYKTPSSYGHFYFMEDVNKIVNAQRINPTLYKVAIDEVQSPRTLVFSESYDPNWILEIQGVSILPYQVYGVLQGYRIPANMYGDATLHYRSQALVTVGLWISLLTMIVLMLIIFYDKICAWKKDNA